MTPGHPRRPLRIILLLAVSAMGAAACSSGASSTKSATPTAPAPATGSTSPGGTATTGPATTGAACHATTPGTGGGTGGGDVLVPGDIPDTVKFVTFHAADYHVDHPEGWAQQASGSAVTFTDKFNSIRVETAAVPAAPSVASAQANEVAALQTAAACFEAGKVSQVTRVAGPAILITYRADSPADPVTGKVVRLDVERYEFWQAGRQATITLSSPKGSDNVDPWKKVTDSFAWGA